MGKLFGGWEGREGRESWVGDWREEFSGGGEGELGNGEEEERRRESRVED